MFDSACILSLYAETPVHAGTGATFGAIDLPVQREKHTNFPMLPPSSIKGVARDAARASAGVSVSEIFGADVDAGSTHAGAISPTDGRLLLFPVRSLSGIFVWATCPFVIERLRRDSGLHSRLGLGLPLGSDLDVPAEEAWIGDSSRLPESLVLEDDSYAVKKKKVISDLGVEIKKLFPDDGAGDFFRNRLQTHLVLLPDDDFARLTVTATDIVTRIQLTDQKTAGNMWVQEYVPAESLFYSVILAMPSRQPSTALNPNTADEVLGAAHAMLKDRTHLQIGGDETVGRGWMRTKWWGLP